jgi:hypothetical protein
MKLIDVANVSRSTSRFSSTGGQASAMLIATSVSMVVNEAGCYCLIGEQPPSLALIFINVAQIIVSHMRIYLKIAEIFCLKADVCAYAILR